MQLSTKGIVKSHLETIHLKVQEPLKCPMPECVKIYRYKRNLVVHLKKHHFGGLETTKHDEKVKAKIEKLLNQGIILSFKGSTQFP